MNMEWISLGSVFVGSLIVSALLVPLMIRLAFRYGVLDHPGYHKTHQNVHPLLGGGAIYVTFMLIILTGIMLLALSSAGQFPGLTEAQRYLAKQFPVFLAAVPRLLGLLIGGTLIFVLGLVDDIRGVGFSYKVKFVIQGIAAVVLVVSGTRLDFLLHPVLNGIVTILWVVGITNAFNLLDNMDGLSSGVAAIICLILGILTIQQGQYFSALMLLTLAGSTLGFLIYNFHPSKIFMGDAGSLFIGYTIAALTVSSSYVTTRSISQLPVVIPILVLGVPLFDTFSVMVIRWREKRPLFVGDNSHFSHRLLKLGMSTRQAVIFIYLVTLCVGISAILIPDLHILGSILVLIQEALIFGLISLLMVKGHRLHLLHRAVKQDLEKIQSMRSDNGTMAVK
ncbi:undecaprenyl/decaprenyl-phosphate alpha-N-acetylglucosaminyl 1-phosphate transferase [candidate division KSB3 bacterium]|uniref:Undecaprenyl/decaprenyl-phosphate alpha-N-acetylglucosaminyl 1-phosphate transferase n=1 Tax=candidate division KSB3 bacterium TaxID=2044937 RepID=A0A9D5JXL3_9BACT|nr:undecaprenyl/decaprenyl-phosphate alpha-N-acetylglucosaminyl 1-phosphate transferase [candidate division KSB3 bacterium]MBD3326028.1 undecaprenyl/decaprenyl-phosphate alpha-N-acetylglucosaminyl 1-phosphate transferase [candidate division KSB3 bacterium]